MENFGSSFNWQRQFFVTDHVKHRNGFTLYKIISVVYPKRIPEAGTKIVVWKRYSEFKSLHKELKSRHASLRLDGDFPPLTKSSFFDRFSPDVINDRKKFISGFLNFIAKCPSLFTADIFVKFFQDGYNISEYDGKKSDSKDVSPNYENVSCVDSPLIFLYSHGMGQVLNSEGSRNSDEESSDDNKFETKLKYAKNDSSMFHKLRMDYGNDECNFTFVKMNSNDGERYSYTSKMNNLGTPDYWEEAIAHAEEAHQQEVLGHYEISFAMYKTAIVCLLSGVQTDQDKGRRARVKDLTSQYLQQAEWIYNNYLTFRTKPPTPKLARIPWRSRSQLRRYKVFSVLGNNLLVQDMTENTFVVIKGVLKSSCPLDRSDVCILPSDMPYMVRLLALHETETTVFFVLEHVRYGKLWNHLEHYFNRRSVNENLDTEITCVSPREKDEQSVGSDENSIASSGSNNNHSLSRLESSMYTDTMSCESLSSHDENYFDLIEDYARAKSQKLKEIQDFNERRKHVESIRPVKKTVSQVDLKSMDDSNYEQHRSHSLTDLSHDCDREHDAYHCGYVYGGVDDACVAGAAADYRRFSSDEDEPREGDDLSSIDIDTQQLLRNAQRLIESINETLSKSETTSASPVLPPPPSPTILSPSQSTIPAPVELPRDNVNDDRNYSEINPTEGRHHSSCESEAPLRGEESRVSETKISNCAADSVTKNIANDSAGLSSSMLHHDYGIHRYNDFDSNVILSPTSESIPSITEEYSITAIILRNGISSEMIKKWAAQILVAVETLHANGVICRDLNPNNILLADNGSIKLTYFFRYPNVDPTLDIEAKEKLYVAPEVDNTNYNVTFASDWWSFGAILYELVTLQNLYQSHSGGISSHTILNFPDRVNAETKSLITELLRYEPNERLGSGISGADGIKAHPYFADINWEEI